MHDPMTVAFEIKSPFRKKSSIRPSGWWRDTLITIWHVDPCSDGTDDSCYYALRDKHGFKSPKTRRWRFHFWHWRIQIHPIHSFKRWMWSRCSGCGGSFAWGYAPTSRSWDSTGPRWFRGEEGIYHSDCYSKMAEGADA